MSNEERESDLRVLRDVPVDWEALEDAFENNAPEVHSYLHLGSGEVLRLVDGVADPEMQARIVSDTQYFRIESVSSREQYRWMERFIQMVEEPQLRAELAQAIDGKGAFRRFKDVLMGQAAERERWFAFRSERLKVFMEAWLAAHAIRPVPRSAEQNAEAPASEHAVPRRGRGADVVRRLLREVTDVMSTRDLEKVLVFAEFVRSRRAARGEHSQLPDELPSQVEASLGDPSVPAVVRPDPRDDASEHVPPSESRKLSSVR
jgi:hypothetical protein